MKICRRKKFRFQTSDDACLDFIYEIVFSYLINATKAVPFYLFKFTDNTVFFAGGNVETTDFELCSGVDFVYSKFICVCVL